MTTPTPHKWVNPPPGQGRSSEKVCAVCGTRMSTADPNSSCGGRDPTYVVETKNDYDPFDGGS